MCSAFDGCTPYLTAGLCIIASLRLEVTDYLPDTNVSLGCSTVTGRTAGGSIDERNLSV